MFIPTLPLVLIIKREVLFTPKWTSLLVLAPNTIALAGAPVIIVFAVDP
jgi:hypothetical protein